MPRNTTKIMFECYGYLDVSLADLFTDNQFADWQDILLATCQMTALVNTVASVEKKQTYIVQK